MWKEQGESSRIGRPSFKLCAAIVIAVAIVHSMPAFIGTGVECLVSSPAGVPGNVVILTRSVCCNTMMT